MTFKASLYFRINIVSQCQKQNQLKIYIINEHVTEFKAETPNLKKKIFWEKYFCKKQIHIH